MRLAEDKKNWGTEKSENNSDSELPKEKVSQDESVKENPILLEEENLVKVEPAKIILPQQSITLKKTSMQDNV